MKKGVVIACKDIASEFDLITLVQLVLKNKNTVICLVNNGSIDPTRQLLAVAKNYLEERVYIYNLSRAIEFDEAAQKGAEFLCRELQIKELSFLEFDGQTFSIKDSNSIKIQA